MLISESEIPNLIKQLEDIKISDGIKSEFKDEKMFEKLIKAGKTKSKCFKNDIVEQQV